MNFEVKSLARADLEVQNAIHCFEGENRFLSNFAHSDVSMYGIVFPTVEHAFAAAKLDPNGGVFTRAEVLTEMKVIAQAPEPGDAKRLGRRQQWKGKPFMRADWDRVKEELVLTLLRRKFENPALRARLLATGDRLLVEGNTWGDRIWGMVERDGVFEGRNMLGEVLMQVRAEVGAA